MIGDASGESESWANAGESGGGEGGIRGRKEGGRRGEEGWRV